MKSMSFVMRNYDSSFTPYTSPFLASTTYCNQDLHIGIEVRFVRR